MRNPTAVMDDDEEHLDVVGLMVTVMADPSGGDVMDQFRACRARAMCDCLRMSKAVAL